jgi:hypothetical protein
MNLITEAIKEIERQDRVNDIDLSGVAEILHEADKAYNKALTIHSVVDTFFCGVKGGYCMYEEKNGRCTQKSSCINKITK